MFALCILVGSLRWSKSVREVDFLSFIFIEFNAVYSDLIILTCFNQLWYIFIPFVPFHVQVSLFTDTKICVETLFYIQGGAQNDPVFDVDLLTYLRS
jgi:hypothetical protein